VADLESRIERELVAAAGRSGRLRYARSPLPSPAALAAVAASAVLLMAAAAAGFSRVNQSPAHRPASDERPATTPSPHGVEPRTLGSPGPAPAELAKSYSSLADGKVHKGAPVQGRRGHEKGRDATVTIHGTATGGCIAVMFDGDLGPGGSCFTVRDIRAGTQWLTTGGLLFVLVPDAATDISVQSRDGTRRPTTAASNLVVAEPSDTVRFSLAGQMVTVRAKARSR
jgi:hypothetical protein